jgi:hypothetical protein
VELSDSNHEGQDDLTGDGNGGQGAPSAELTIPNLIGSTMVMQVLPSATNQLMTTAPLGSGHPKKKHLVLVSKRNQLASSDQVTTELFPHHAPRHSLGLVATRLVFWHLFEASNASLRLLGPTLQLGLTLSQPKDFRHH